MGNLKDELLKKGLADEKRARQMAHDEKARRNRLGKDAVADERERQAAERVARDQERRESDRRREAERQKDDAARTARRALVQILRDHALTRGLRGQRRWHFATRDRKLPFLELSDDVAKRLEGGQLAICEVPDSAPEEFVVVPAATAARVRETAADYVLFLNPPGAPREP